MNRVRRKLTSAIILAGAMNAAHVSALGLGELTMHSALNQPMEAEIKLLNVGDLADNQILVGLASRQDFEKSGVERNFFITNLKFEVQVDGRGNGVIKIKTHRLVNEPYLNFVVEARWPAGKLLREYTALMDLPIYTEGVDTAVNLGSASPEDMKQVMANQEEAKQEEQPKKSEPPVATSAALAESISKESPESPRAPDMKPTVPTAKKTPTTHYQGETYRIKRNDTLWAVAQKVKPSEQVSIQQTIVALQKINPDAFIRNNINLVKAGSVLRLPSERQVQDINVRQALRDIAEQNEKWKSGMADVQLDATAKGAAPKKPIFTQEGRLKLSSAKTGHVAQADAAAAGGKEALQSALAVSQENLDKVERENEELLEKNTQLQERLEDFERLIQLKDDQLAVMQSKVGQDIKEPVPAEEAVMEDAVVKETPEMPGQKVQESITTPEKPAPEPAVVEPKEEKPDAGLVTRAPEKSFVERMQESPLYLGGALLLLILVIAGLFMKRRAASQVESEVFPPDDLEDVSDEVEEGEALSEQDEYQEVEQELEEEYEEEGDEEAAPSSEAKSETGDAIGEADIYVAYGRYQHAIDLLKNAINSEQNRTDLRVKILEVYLEAGEQAGFAEQFSELQNLGDEDAVAKAKEMLSTVDGAADWLEGVGVSSELDQVEEQAVVDVESEDAVTTEEIDQKGVKLEDELDIEFDTEDLDDMELDLGELDLEGGASETLKEETEEEIGSADMGIDYDLDGIDLGIKSDAVDAAEAEQEETQEEESEDDFELDLVEEESPEELLEFESSLEETLGDDLEIDIDEEMTADEAREVEEEEEEVEVDLESAELDLGELDVIEDEALDQESLEDELVHTADDLNDLECETDLQEDVEAEAEVEIEVEASDEIDLEIGESFDADDLDAAADAEIAQEAAASSTSTEDVDTDDEFEFLSDTDEVATKLDLARAYIEMGDIDGAKDILDEVIQEGEEEQKAEANQLLANID